MTTNAKPPVAANLRALKMARGCTGREIAAAVDTNERTVQLWLSEGGTIPSWPSMCALAEFFGTEPHLLYKEPTPA